MTDAQVVAAIRRNHLKANISDFDGVRGRRALWQFAWIDPGGTVFGPGPYLKVPVVGDGWDGTWQRAYAPARLRRQIAERWTYSDATPAFNARQIWALRNWERRKGKVT